MALRTSNRRIILSDDEVEDGELGNTQSANDEPPHTQGRAAKQKAKEAWQDLIPGARSQKKSKTKATSATSGKPTSAQSQTNLSRKYLAPAIDDSSSGSEMESGPAASRSQAARSASLINGRKTQVPVTSKDSSEDETADEDKDNYPNGGDERDDEDTEKTDDDGDNDLRRLETNPRALDDIFDAEEAHFVDSDRDQDVEMAPPDDNEDQGRQTTQSGKAPSKRARRARVDSADERESGDEVEDEPPVKKVKPTPVRSSAGKKSNKSARQTSAVKAKRVDTSKSPGHERTHSTSKSASKRKREKPNEDIEWGKEWPAKRGRTNTTPDSNPSGPTTISDDDDNDDSDGIELVLDQSKDRLELKQQRPRVQAVVSTAIENVKVDLCLVNAYPEGPEKVSEYGRRWLIAGAKKHKDADIIQRLKSDNVYWRKMASLATQRISNTRGKVKRIAEQLPPIFYSLTSGDANYVTWLTEGNRFLYPNDYRNRTVVGTEPFNVPVFEHLLRTAFFNKTRSTGYRLLDRFKSSLPDRPDEKEIPGPMLGLVATALYAAIEDYRSPRYNAADFNGNIYLDVYRDVMTILNNVKRDRPRKYHNMMHNFYKNICMGSGPSSRGTAINLLNIADMPDE